jgi:hypothetical protein
MTTTLMTRKWSGYPVEHAKFLHPPSEDQAALFLIADGIGSGKRKSPLKAVGVVAKQHPRSHFRGKLDFNHCAVHRKEVDLCSSATPFLHPSHSCKGTCASTSGDLE